MVAFNRWTARRTLSAVAVVSWLLAPSLRSAETAPAADIVSAVSRGSDPSVYQYDYTILNTSDTVGIAALKLDAQMAFITRGVVRPGDQGRAPGGWTQAPGAFIGHGIWHVKGLESTAVLQPGQSLRGLQVRSQTLPGIARMTVFPAVVYSRWDERPARGRSSSVIGPVIGSSKRQPLAAAIDIVQQVRINVIPALSADGDVTSEQVDRALSEAISHLQRQELQLADVALREAVGVDWDRASEWRQEIHHCLELDVAYVFNLVGRTVELEPFEVTTVPVAGRTDDVWAFSGLASPSITDLDAFVRHTSIAVVGTVTAIQVEALDDSHLDVRTRLRVRPTEILWGDIGLSDVDVWLRGGAISQVQVPSEPVFGVSPGDALFVAANRINTSRTTVGNQFQLAGFDTIATIRDSSVNPPATLASNWVRSVTAQGRQSSGRVESDTASFLRALRQAAQMR